MLGSMSVVHWLVVICVAFLLFGGKNKISNLMSDLGKGVRELKHGLSDAKEADAEVRKSLSEKI